MQRLQRLMRHDYFPAIAALVLAAAFWVAGLCGGFALLRTARTPVLTLTWMLFVYALAVLSPLATLLAALDLAGRLLRNRDRGRGTDLY